MLSARPFLFALGAAILMVLGCVTAEVHSDEALLCGLNSASDSKPCVIGAGWGSSLELDNTGFYNDYMRELQARSAVAFTYVPVPFKRARRAFMQSQVSCIYPSKIDLFKALVDQNGVPVTVGTQAVMVKTIHIFSREGLAPISKLADVQGHMVATSLGTIFSTYLDDLDVELMAVADDMQKALLLDNQRVDYILGSMPDTAFVFNEINRPLPSKGPAGGLETYHVGIHCYRSDESEKLVAEFNTHITAMRESGWMASLLRKHGIADPSSLIPQP